jgi:squalene synthase HpnC
MGVNHYENFPVASVLLPRRLHAPVLAIYDFARTADDLADEGNAAPQQRLEQLSQLSVVIDQIDAGTYPDHGHRWSALALAAHEHHLPLQAFRDLLSAFSQDAAGTRFVTDDDLLDYCRRSANPVGRLMLTLYGQRSPHTDHLSDQICTGLQLVNFWQDVAIDLQKGRCYLPDDALARFGVTPPPWQGGVIPSAWSRLMQERTAVARSLLKSGQPLCRQLGGRIGWELRLVIQGGLHIARQIDAVRGNVFQFRPTLKARHWPALVMRAALLS